MAKLKLFYVEMLYGCGIRAYKTLKECEREEIKENGTRNFRLAREATAEDIASVKSMGGYIPVL